MVMKEMNKGIIYPVDDDGEFGFGVQDKFAHLIPKSAKFREEIGEFQIDFFGRRYHQTNGAPWGVPEGRNRLLTLRAFMGGIGPREIQCPAPHPIAVCDACGFNEKWDNGYLPQQFTVKVETQPRFRSANAFYDLRNGKTICHKCNLTTGSEFELDSDEWYSDMGEHTGPENFRKEKRQYRGNI
jgi:hypothetical protein